MSQNDDLISRQAAIDALGTPHGILYPIRTIESLPTAQPERKKGRWIDDTNAESIVFEYKCSICGRKLFLMSKPTNYCPYCGAQMDGGEQE